MVSAVITINIAVIVLQCFDADGTK